MVLVSDGERQQKPSKKEWDHHYMSWPCPYPIPIPVPVTTALRCSHIQRCHSTNRYGHPLLPPGQASPLFLLPSAPGSSAAVSSQVCYSQPSPPSNPKAGDRSSPRWSTSHPRSSAAVSLPPLHLSTSTQCRAGAELSLGAPESVPAPSQLYPGCIPASHTRGQG